MRKALLIGIDEYPQPYRLNGCVNDINVLEPLLSRDGNGGKLFDVKKLPNLKSKKEAKEALKGLFSGDEDVALFYFSGHGFRSENGTSIVFPDDVEESPLEGIYLNEILDFSHNSKVKNKVFILDCCFSGAMGNISPTCDDSILYPGTTILSACRDSQSAVEANGNGVFTHLLCMALRGEAASIDGVVTLGSIYSYIDEMFGSWEQRPVFKTNVSQFVAFRKVPPRVDLNIIRRITKYFDSADSEYKLDPSYEYTNDPSNEFRVKPVKPFADKEHVKILKELQKLESIGLVEPQGEDHMYFAAMHSKSCVLTQIGKHYWNLVKKDRI